MKRLIVALALVASLGMAGHALAMDKKINIFNGAQYDIYTLYLSPTNANDWEENLLKQETLPNGDKVDVEVSRTEKAEAWDVKVTNKAGETMTWIGVPLNKAGQITLLPKPHPSPSQDFRPYRIPSVGFPMRVQAEPVNCISIWCVPFKRHGENQSPFFCRENRRRTAAFRYKEAAPYPACTGHGAASSCFEGNRELHAVRRRNEADGLFDAFF